MNTAPRMYTAALCLGLASLLLPATLQAQPVEPTYEEIGVNHRAIEAIKEERYGDAIELLEEALAKRALNIFYLNLGRAHARAGHCGQAWEAYEAVPGSVSVTSPPQEAVERVLADYRSELLEGCPTRLNLTCPPGSTVSIDGDSPVPCPNGLIDVAPGRHAVELLDSGERRQVKVDVPIGATRRLFLREVSGEEAGPSEVESVREPPQVKAPILPVVVTGTGAALLLSALVIDQTLLASDFEALEGAGSQKRYDRIRGDIDATQSLNLGLIIVGALAAGVGSGWWIYQSSEGTERAVVWRW